MNPIQKANVQEIVSLFDFAETKIKEIEIFSQEIATPPLNELRYAGYHLARAICEDDEQGINKQIEKANGHCQRAIYDTYELGLIYTLERIMDFEKVYTPYASHTLKAIPNYIDYLTKSKDAAKFISNIKEQNHENRYKYYKECEPIFNQLREIAREFEQASVIINASLEEQNKKDKTDTRRFIIKIVVAVSALGIAIVTALSMLF